MPGRIFFLAWRLEGEAARKLGDEPAARRYFEEALRSVKECLRIMQTLGNKPFEAGSRGQLARIHLLLGDLAAAERHANEARQIHEFFGLKEAWKDYEILSEIAQAGFGDGTFGPAEEEALAQIDQLPAPFPDFAACLRRIAAGQRPSIPSGLPAELRQLLEDLGIVHQG